MLPPRHDQADVGSTGQETSITDLDSVNVDIVAEFSVAHPDSGDETTEFLGDGKNDGGNSSEDDVSGDMVIELPSSPADNERNGAPFLLNYEFLASIFDLRPIFLPMSTKRAIWLISLFSIVSGLTFWGWKEDAVSKFRAYASEEILPLMAFLFGYEPLTLVLAMLVSRYPSSIEHTTINHRDEIVSPYWRVLEPLPSPNPFLAIIIPCHNSGQFIADTIVSCLRHVSPMQIFVMDNGRGETPSDKTRDAVHAVHSRINYFYLPKTGNKTIALLLGAQYVKKKHPILTEVLIIDDDTHLPTEFSVRREFFQDSAVKGIVFPIRAASPYVKEPLLSRHQDLEYKIADLEMAFLDRTKSVMRPHGAASLWRIDALISVLQKHNAIWGGEDVMMGLLLKYLHFDEGVGQLRLDLHCYFKTTVPQTYLGDKPNFYEQRVRAWNEAQYLYPWNLIFRPLFTGWRLPPLALLSIKNSQFYNLYTQLINIIRYPMIAMLAEYPRFWVMFAGIKGLELLLTLVFNYVKIPSYLRSDLVAVGTYPLYKEVSALMGTLAFFRALLISGPDSAHPRSLHYRIKHHLITLPPAISDPEPEDIEPISPHSESYYHEGSVVSELANNDQHDEQQGDPPSVAITPSVSSSRVYNRAAFFASLSRARASCVDNVDELCDVPSEEVVHQGRGTTL